MSKYILRSACNICAHEKNDLVDEEINTRTVFDDSGEKLVVHTLMISFCKMCLKRTLHLITNVAPNTIEEHAA